MRKKIAVLWDERYIQENKGISRLFCSEKLKETMQYFSNEARDKGLETYVAHYSSYENGKLKRGYYFDGNWKEETNVKIDLVFDKFYFNGDTKKLKYRIAEEVGIFNDPGLEELCKDKLRLYEVFAEYIPKTLKVSKDLTYDLGKLETEKVVIKPRFGSAGQSVKIVAKENVPDELECYDDKEVEKGNVLLQEFKDSSNGIPSIDVDGFHDLRIIIVNGRPSYTFVRTPNEGKISNVSRGGNIKPVPVEDIPQKAMEIVEDIDEELLDFKDRIYSIDFLFDEKGEPWVIELNSKPGITFGDREVTERKKKFIDDIIVNLSN